MSGNWAEQRPPCCSEADDAAAVVVEVDDADVVRNSALETAETAAKRTASSSTHWKLKTALFADYWPDGRGWLLAAGKIQQRLHPARQDSLTSRSGHHTSDHSGGSSPDGDAGALRRREGVDGAGDDDESCGDGKQTYWLRQN